MSFSIDGTKKRLDFLPQDESYYTSMASNLRAYTEDGSNESMYITFMSVDLKSLELPVELPLPRDPKNPFSALASVGFGYINADGVEWAGPGKVTIDSFENGVLTGHFDGVSIPHTDKSLPAIKLDAGSFSARLE